MNAKQALAISNFCLKTVEILDKLEETDYYLMEDLKDLHGELDKTFDPIIKGENDSF